MFSNYVVSSFDLFYKFIFFYFLGTFSSCFLVFTFLTCQFDFLFDFDLSIFFYVFRLVFTSRSLALPYYWILTTIDERHT